MMAFAATHPFIFQIREFWQLEKRGNNDLFFQHNGVIPLCAYIKVYSNYVIDDFNLRFMLTDTMLTVTMLTVTRTWEASLT